MCLKKDDHVQIGSRMWSQSKYVRSKLKEKTQKAKGNVELHFIEYKRDTSITLHQRNPT